MSHVWFVSDIKQYLEPSILLCTNKTTYVRLQYLKLFECKQMSDTK